MKEGREGEREDPHPNFQNQWILTLFGRVFADVIKDFKMRLS